MLAVLQGCSSVLFFEARKRKDLYVWLARAPDGPSIKFHCANGEFVSICQICIRQSLTWSQRLRQCGPNAETLRCVT